MTKERIEKTEDEWQQELTSEQVAVCRQKGTERAFTGKYYNCKDEGTYVCSCCGNPLFSSETKYDSGSGWPSYFQPTDEDAIKIETDTTHGMNWVEVMCNACDAHLGHVFEDGPQPTGLRYCINSVSIDLNKSEQE
ncbi:MAG: peptide-methionine (R)-S-oxide reductase MsrB [Gammaproteobacteria bacterium]|nr:peptide-methionine (R)-S-oxide reductase MsrB [Gammaproteobacteria bacterium]